MKCLEYCTLAKHPWTPTTSIPSHIHSNSAQCWAVEPIKLFCFLVVAPTILLMRCHTRYILSMRRCVIGRCGY